MNLPMLRLRLLPALGLIGWLVLSQSATASTPLIISNAWVSATPPGMRSAAVYLTIQNPTTISDRLLSAVTPAAESVMVHQTRLVDGVYEMREGALQIPAKESVELKPAQSHLMLDGLRAPLKAGSHIALTLRFAHARRVQVDVDVRPVEITPY